jgi:hypothetical protein
MSKATTNAAQKSDLVPLAKAMGKPQTKAAKRARRSDCSNSASNGSCGAGTIPAPLPFRPSIGVDP